jgi:hypothetical protein
MVGCTETAQAEAAEASADALGGDIREGLGQVPT